MVRTHPDPPFIGGVAQLGERLLCKQEVIGSIPFTSTISQKLMVSRQGKLVSPKAKVVAGDPLGLCCFTIAGSTAIPVPTGDGSFFDM